MLYLVLTFMVELSRAGIIGYDCASPKTDIIKIGLTGVKEWRYPALMVGEPVVTDLQVLQLSKQKKILSRRCKLDIRQSIHHCGMHSHVSIVRGGFKEKTYVFDRALCIKAIEEHRIKYPYGPDTFIYAAEYGTHKGALTVAGSTTLDGKCAGATYS